MFGVDLLAIGIIAVAGAGAYELVLKPIFIALGF